MWLADVQKVQIEAITLDDAITLLAVLKATKVEYGAQGIPAPEWFDARLDQVEREVQSRKRDYLLAALKAAQSRVAATKSREQRQADAQSEVERLQKLLGQ